CDRFCLDIGAEATLTTRFSPGYGDLDIFSQKIFLSVLDASRLAGITLSESMLMSPSKSVTALCGVKSRTE
ncbi:MAG: Vitamin B12 dependent methionine synthase activation subunit, partial [Clostridia bacterium]|nr:Vitamin B12 dependent methionine synthase activation subunit [Clostridia bacterium]